MHFVLNVNDGKHNGSHNNNLNQMFWLLFETKLQGLENAKSSKDSKCNSLEYVNEKYECAQLVDSNLLIRLQHHSPLCIVSCGFVKFDNQTN
jgi:hypothetical protein